MRGIVVALVFAACSVPEEKRPGDASDTAAIDAPGDAPETTKALLTLALGGSLAWLVQASMTTDWPQ